MRLNKYIAQASGLSRRAADNAISENRVSVNGAPAVLGIALNDQDRVTLDGKELRPLVTTRTLMLNKPRGYVVSRNGQGSRTIYDLLPLELHTLKPVGRLDKDTSGLLLLTNDGMLAQQLTHPKHMKTKIYQIELMKPLQPLHHQMITQIGLHLADGVSKFDLSRMNDQDDNHWEITMHEGRNRQIRRTFASLGYGVTTLHRIRFGDYFLGTLRGGEYTDTGEEKSN